MCINVIPIKVLQRTSWAWQLEGESHRAGHLDPGPLGKCRPAGGIFPTSRALGPTVKPLGPSQNVRPVLVCVFVKFWFQSFLVFF